MQSIKPEPEIIVEYKTTLLKYNGSINNKRKNAAHLFLCCYKTFSNYVSIYFEFNFINGLALYQPYFCNLNFRLRLFLSHRINIMQKLFAF